MGRVSTRCFLVPTQDEWFKPSFRPNQLNSLFVTMVILDLPGRVHFRCTSKSPRLQSGVPMARLPVGMASSTLNLGFLSVWPTNYSSDALTPPKSVTKSMIVKMAQMKRTALERISPLVVVVATRMNIQRLTCESSGEKRAFPVSYFPFVDVKSCRGHFSVLLIDSWPWMVSLRLAANEPDGHTCGASIINRKFLITVCTR